MQNDENFFECGDYDWSFRTSKDHKYHYEDLHKNIYKLNISCPECCKYFPSDSHEAEHVCNNATTLFKETKTLALKLEHNDKAAKKDAKKKKKKKKRARKEK